MTQSPGHRAVPLSLDAAVLGSRVLVVDDEPDNVVLFEHVLATVGLTEVYGLQDPTRTMDVIRERAIDLVLLDLSMPGMDGYEVLDMVRSAQDPEAFLPILVLTADPTSSARDAALQAGANDFLTRPVDMAEALLRIQNLLRIRRLHVQTMARNTELQAELSARAAAAQRRARAKRAKRAAIDTILSDNRLRMVFQPIMTVDEVTVVGVEALARISHDPRRPPDVWFDEAEAVGRGLELELAAVQVALAELTNMDEGFMAINVSPGVARTTEFAAALRQVDGSRIVVELTEHTRVHDEAVLQVELDDIRSRGVRLAVDDAGAGYAGLQRILGLSPDIVKLDVALIRGIDADPARRALATAFVAFTNEIGAMLIAEGIETDAELETLRALGVPWAQGYRLGRPGPMPAITS
ncbi:EAL domain-containing protein [Euzebya rosea]|uniref:EAL domain-containing response regulator n=1 Tax=Euzebya rosea TaxID=2052804 RepID=UPI000D3E7525|nr:EAL domain-containing response regulator [Euzebya rosea]